MFSGLCLSWELVLSALDYLPPSSVSTDRYALPFCIGITTEKPPAIQTYLVDAFTLYAASAIAAVTVLRSLVGAFLPMAGPALYQKLGLGWGNSLLGFIALGLIPVPWFFIKHGERIRKDPRFQVKL